MKINDHHTKSSSKLEGKSKTIERFLGLKNRMIEPALLFELSAAPSKEDTGLKDGEKEIIDCTESIQGITSVIPIFKRAQQVKHLLEVNFLN